MHRKLILFFSLATLSICGGPDTLAQQVNTAPARPPGEINVEHSRVFTRASGTGMGQSHGVEAKLLSGNLQLGATRNAGRMVFDMRSFEADTPRSRKTVGLEGSGPTWGIKKVNQVIHSDRILDSERFPKAMFSIESAVRTGVDNRTGSPAYQLTGLFTLRDRTQRISFPIAVREEKGWLHVLGNFSFKQSDYGITPFSRGFGMMGIADELKVFGDLWVAPHASSVASLRSSTLK